LKTQHHLLPEFEVFKLRAKRNLDKARRCRLIDLFSGAGGMTLGFTSFGHSFVPVWANDFNSHAVETYNSNFGEHCSGEDLACYLERNGSVPKADVVIGGPPCQGFSLLNKNKSTDPRKQLWRSFLHAVDLSGASVFVMENVPQLLGSEEFPQIVATAESLGFLVKADVLLAANYGVAQNRRRAIIIGSKDVDPSLVGFPPKETHSKPIENKPGELFQEEGEENILPWETVRNAIGDLDEPIGTSIREVDPPYDLHFGRNPTPLSLKRYMTITEGENRFQLEERNPEITPACWKRKRKGGTDLFGRMWWDRPSVTIRTEFYKPEKGRYLHPVSHRPITHREAARLQSFPDSFSFRGTKIEIARQIGNAVPPLLASRIADCVYALLKESKTKSE